MLQYNQGLVVGEQGEGEEEEKLEVSKEFGEAEGRQGGGEGGQGGKGGGQELGEALTGLTQSCILQIRREV